MSDNPWQSFIKNWDGKVQPGRDKQKEHEEWMTHAQKYMDDFKARTEPMYVEAHEVARNNREALEVSANCGCFFCLTIFSPTEIRDWCDDYDKESNTAICPHCGIDSVLAQSSGFPLTEEFLTKMKWTWFGDT